MGRRLESAVLVGSLCVWIIGCASTSENRPKNIKEAQSPAWSMKARHDEMVIAVSPAGKALRIAGSAGLVIGTAVDAGVNAKYGKQVRDLLKGYDTAAVFDQRLESRLKTAVGPKLQRVDPLTSTAGFSNQREAEQARLKGLAKKGADVVLDLNVTYGLYGPEGVMAGKLLADLKHVPDGKKIWDDKLVVTSGPVLANMKLGDPTDLIMPDVGSGLTVDEEAIRSWSSDDGTILRTRFESLVDGTVSALLCALGVVDEALGEYHLGKLAMCKRDFKEAEVHLAKAVRLDPALIDAQNARAVNLGHNEQMDEAIAMAKALTESQPGYGPAWFNLAWWYAVEKKDAASAKPCYEKALSLGMFPEKKIEKAIK